MLMSPQPEIWEETNQTSKPPTRIACQCHDRRFTSVQLLQLIRGLHPPHIKHFFDGVPNPSFFFACARVPFSDSPTGRVRS